MFYVDIRDKNAERKIKLQPIGCRGIQRDTVYIVNDTQLRNLIGMEYASGVTPELYHKIDSRMRSLWIGGEVYDGKLLAQIYGEFQDEITEALDDYLDEVDMRAFGHEEPCDIMEAIDIRLDAMMRSFGGNLRYLLSGGYSCHLCKLNGTDSYVADIVPKHVLGDVDNYRRAYMYRSGADKIDSRYGLLCRLMGRNVKLDNLLVIKVPKKNQDY